MLFFCVSVDEYIIEVDQYSRIQEINEDAVHHALKGGWCVLGYLVQEFFRPQGGAQAAEPSLGPEIFWAKGPSSLAGPRLLLFQVDVGVILREHRLFR